MAGLKGRLNSALWHIGGAAKGCNTCYIEPFIFLRVDFAVHPAVQCLGTWFNAICWDTTASQSTGNCSNLSVEAHPSNIAIASKPVNVTGNFILVVPGFKLQLGKIISAQTVRAEGLVILLRDGSRYKKKKQKEEL